MNDLAGDIRYALRQATNRKLFSAIVISLVAFGIGANTVLFSFVDGLLLKTLPVRDPGNLFELLKKRPVQARPDEIFTYAEYQVLQRSGAGFLSSVEAECPLGPQPIGTGSRQGLVAVSAVSASLFEDLGLSAERGRLFNGAEDSSSGSIPAILSYRLWKSEWGGDAHAAGETIHVKGHAFTIVGVLPRMFHGLNLDSQPDVVLPLSAVQFIGLQPLAASQFNVYVRLRRGIAPSVAAKRAEPLLREGVEESFRGYVPPIPAAALKSQLEFTASLLSLEHGASQVRGLFSKAVVFLMGSVAVLLFIVCFNVGGLLLAKSQARWREFAIRRSLGATGFRIVRQMMAETFLLDLLGTVLGVCLACALAPVLLRLIPVLRNPATQLVISPVIDLSPDWRILLFISGGCLVSGMLFGMLPAFAGLRFDLNNELKQLAGSRTPHAGRTGNALVCLQVMLTVVLITASGLMLRSYWNLLHAATGFDGDHVVTFRVSPFAAGYVNEQIRSYYDRLLQHVRELPQIRAASLVSYGVMREKGLGAVVSPTGQVPGPGTFRSTSLNLVSPGYFETMGIHLLEGRDLRPDDGAVKEPPFSVVVDETFAHTFFAGRDVIGRTFGNGGAPTYRIVGLVTTAKYRSLREAPPPTFYAHPIWGSPATSMLNLYVRTYGDPLSVISRVRESVQIADPNVPIVEITTLKMEEQDSVWQERLVMLMTAFFGVAGLALANIGLYGVLTQFVVRHTRDIGIRMALGAQARHIVRAVCLSSMLSVLAGLVVGIAVSAAALRLARAFLYGLSAFDLFSYVLAIGLILTAALLAALVPVSQATRLDPAATLRAE